MDLKRLAVVLENGDKQAVVVDGIEQPLYDSIAGSLMFSPDSQRLAYFGVKNQKRVVVIDGQEGTPYSNDSSYLSPLFSPDSQHLAYIASKGGKKMVVVDGKESNPYDEIAALSYDLTSKFVAFWGRTGKQWRVVVDGKEGKAYDELESNYLFPGLKIGLSKDGQHVVYRAVQGKKHLMVIDGKEGKAYDEIGQVNLSQDGSTIAYTARTADTWHVVWNEQESPAYQAVGRPIFSPDGKHMIYSAQTKDRWTLVMEGSAGKSYDRMQDPIYSPDGQHLAFMAGVGDKAFVVADGQEQKRYDQITRDVLTYSPDSRHLAYPVFERGKYKIVVDGIEGASFDAMGPPVYSPDSQHLAFAIQAGIKQFAVVDGQEQQAFDQVGSMYFDPDGTLRYYGLRGTALYLVESRLVTSAEEQAHAQQTSTAIADANATLVARAQPTATALAYARATTQAGATATRAAQATVTAFANANATATAKAIPVVTNPGALDWPIALSDTFDTIGNDWTAGSFTFDSGKVIKSIANGKYTWDLKATEPFVDRDLPTMIPLRDMAVGIDGRRVSGAVGSAYGLAFRDNLHNYYLFLVADDQSYQFSYGSGSSSPKVLQSGKSSAIRPGGVNRLIVIARGSHFAFYVNNQLILQADDVALPKGSAGPAVELFNAGDKAVFEFDNFEAQVPTVGPTLATARKWPVVVSDTFDNNVNGWPLDDSVSGTATAVIGPSVYRWTANATDSWIKWEIPDKIAPRGDMYVSVVARRVSGPTGAGYGLAFRENDAHDSLYTFEVRDDAKFRIQAIVNGQFIDLVDWTSSGSIRPGAANRLTAVASGGYLTLFINDQFVSQVADDRLSSGHVGILFELHSGESGVFEYDTFEIRAP